MDFLGIRGYGYGYAAPNFRQRLSTSPSGVSSSFAHTAPRLDGNPFFLTLVALLVAMAAVLAGCGVLQAASPAPEPCLPWCARSAEDARTYWYAMAELVLRRIDSNSDFNELRTINHQTR